MASARCREQPADEAVGRIARAEIGRAVSSWAVRWRGVRPSSYVASSPATRQQRGRGTAQHPVRLVVDFAGLGIHDRHVGAARRAAGPGRRPATPRPRCRRPASARKARGCSAAAIASAGSISPNHTTPGRSRLPQRRNAAAGGHGLRAQPRPRGQGCSQRSARMSPCSRSAAAAGALVQVVDVLRDHRQHAGPPRVVGQRQMAGVRLRVAHALWRSAYQAQTRAGSARKPSSLASSAGSKRAIGRSWRRGRWGCRSRHSCRRR